MVRALLVGWAILAADVAYFLWQTGHSAEPGAEGWQGSFNILAFYGGWILLVALLAVTFARRR